jgi:hypothetical protein
VQERLPVLWNSPHRFDPAQKPNREPLQAGRLPVQRTLPNPSSLYSSTSSSIAARTEAARVFPLMDPWVVMVDDDVKAHGWAQHEKLSTVLRAVVQVLLEQLV